MQNADFFDFRCVTGTRGAAQIGTGPRWGGMLRALFVVGALGAFGCASADGHDAKTESETPGAPGSHVWRASSESVTLDNRWSYTSFGMGAAAPKSGSSSATYGRADLSEDALGRLESLQLIPLSEGCTADGYDYDVLTVTDADGTSAAYADTGCPYLRLDAATAMLPYLDVKMLMLSPE